MKKYEETNFEEAGQDDWLMTYSDAITLLMAFFVLLLSVSVVDQSKFEEVFDAINEGTLKKQKYQKSPFDEVNHKMSLLIKKDKLDNKINVTRDPKGLTITFDSSIFFLSGTEAFLPEAVVILKKIAKILKDFKFRNFIIEVEGHTDNIPIHNKLIPSNWELSVLRATNTIRCLIYYGVQKKYLRAIGYGDTKPEVPNMTKSGRPIPANQAKNRRIVINIRRAN